MSLQYATVDTPIGALLVAGDTDGVHRIAFDGTPGPDWAPGMEAAAAQLAAWFAGDRTTLDLPRGAAGTPFQRSVWDQVAAVPFGETTTYGAIAQTLGKPGAARAVGLANGQNPLPLLVPCHRVVGADGSLTGYAGGLERKRWLLAHERRQLALF